jgi:hypothetical protein
MDDRLCRTFFLQPEQPAHRRYEALRAIFLDGHSIEQVAKRFGYRLPALKSLVSRFRTSCRAGDPPPFLFLTGEDDPLANDCARTITDRSCRRSPTADS